MCAVPTLTWLISNFEHVFAKDISQQQGVSGFYLGREETSEFGPADAKTVELQQNAGFSLKKERKEGRDSGFMKTFDQQKRHLCCFVLFLNMRGRFSHQSG